MIFEYIDSQNINDSLFQILDMFRKKISKLKDNLHNVKNNFCIQNNRISLIILVRVFYSRKISICSHQNFDFRLLNKTPYISPRLENMSFLKQISRKLCIFNKILKRIIFKSREHLSTVDQIDSFESKIIYTLWRIFRFDLIKFFH